MPDGYTPFDGTLWRRFGYHGQLNKFFEEISDKRVVIVGPAYYEGFTKVIPLDRFEHILIPEKTAAENHLGILERVKKIHEDETVYFFVAGTIGTWLADQLSNSLSNAYLLDVGMGLDPVFAAKGNPNIATVHFFKKDAGKKHYTERKRFFTNIDLGYWLEIGESGQVTFHYPKVSWLIRIFEMIKTRLLFLYLNVKYGVRRIWNQAKR